MSDVVIRIALREQPGTGAETLRDFGAGPRRYACASAATGASDDPDTFDVLLAPQGSGERFVSSGALTLRRKGKSVSWEPGRALVRADPATQRAWLVGLAEFHRRDAELRRLERELAPIEAGAEADVPFAYRIRGRDKAHWPRIRATLETLARLRLRFAQLEPTCYAAPRELPKGARALVEALVERTALEDRLTAFSDRLEACEDLYEGASDRISDYCWYRDGHILEIGILIFLVVEVILMLTELYLHYVEHLEQMGLP